MGNDFNGVLAVEYVVDTISTAHFDRVNLIKIKVGNSSSNMRLRQISLVVLVGYQVLYRDLFKVDIRNK